MYLDKIAMGLNKIVHSVPCVIDAHIADVVISVFPVNAYEIILRIK